MRLKGTIIKWNDEKGFGFIQSNNGAEVFVHIKSFANQYRRPVVNEIVTFELRSDAKGRSQAQRVKFEVEKIFLPTSTRRSKIYVMVACCFLIFIGYWAYAGKIPTIVFAVYLLTSLFTFFLYAIDKSAAKNDMWRTQESTLHLFAFIGGWPGALIAQTTLRHKSKKQSFRIVFWATVLLNCGLLGWLLSPNGAWAINTIQANQPSYQIDKYLRLLTKRANVSWNR